MDIARHFATDYADARAKFRAAAEAAGARLERHVNPAASPAGVELTTDVAVLGDPAAEKMLLTFSGTHGAEGFCGSGVQTAWLAEGLWREVPADTAQVHVHAINPYGFAALSRTTEDNIDLNRNFVDHAEPPANPRYREVRPILCPENWDESTLDRIRAGVDDYVAREGFWTFREAATAGQYEDPQGIFYGGRGPSWSRRTVEAIVRGRCAGLKHLAVIDYHTGLGPRGFGERIVDHHPGTPGYDRAMAWYEGDAASPHLGTSASAKLTGQMLDAVEDMLPAADVTAIALEYGTQPEDKVIGALVSDNWLRHHGDPGTARGREIKRAVRDAFYQDAGDWKRMIWERALATQRLALKGLAA
ncbi:MAG: hypothetical protein TEF_00680 [Rhizobiales bacterium NRL2]|jgi:hypothetical protein|nr:MAG: hypothetical protein TEF_00680 [Rhizobiales bacterium NRL2]